MMDPSVPSPEEDPDQAADIYEGRSHITLDVKGIKAHFTGRYALLLALVLIFVTTCYTEFLK